MKFKRRVAWALGYDLLSIKKGASSEALTWQLLKASNPDIVLDVGANEGQFATSVLRDAPSQRMVSFEPMSAAHKVLVANCSRFRNWRAAEPMAIGSESGRATINISGRYASSSLLPIASIQETLSPGTGYVGTENVALRRLDDAATKFLKPDDRIYLKMDVQGFEPRVLEGAAGIMDRIAAIQTEFSFVQLYEGETLGFEIIASIISLGFKPFGFSHGLRDSRTKALVQADGFFIRA